MTWRTPFQNDAFRKNVIEEPYTSCQNAVIGRLTDKILQVIF